MRNVKREVLEKLPGYEHLIPDDTAAVIAELDGVLHLLGSDLNPYEAVVSAGLYLDDRGVPIPDLSNLELVNIG